jgi:hypothetical protein
MYISILYDGTITRGAVYGDLPFHLNIITSYVYGCNQRRSSLFDNLSPFFSNEPLAYPILPDFISSVMLGCFDTPLQYSVLIPSLPFAYALFSVLSRIVFLFSGKSFAVVAAPWLFLFLGGLGFTVGLEPEVASDFNADLVHIWGRDRYGYWFHPILHVLLPQRLSLFSMPICWSYILLMIIAKGNWRVYLFCGLIIGILPQVQGHSLITLLEWTYAHALINFPWRSLKEMRAQILLYLVLGVPALTIAIPQLLPFIGRVSQDRFVTFVPVWADDRLDFFTLWWRGLGVFWVMSLFHGPAVLNWTQLKLYIPSLFVFAVSNFIHYQPWNLDNTKVFYNGWIPLAVAVVAHFLATLHSSKRILATLAVFVLLGACGASSALGLWKAVLFGGSVFDGDDVHELAEWAIENSDPKSVWITDSHHNHPIPMLAGRQILFGYRGWLPSHHLNEAGRARAVENLGRNPDATDEIDALGAEFICFCLYHSDELKFRFLPTVRKWRREYHTDRWEIWRRVK